jgi:hypothetical protein
MLGRAEMSAQPPSMLMQSPACSLTVRSTLSEIAHSLFRRSGTNQIAEPAEPTVILCHYGLL